jgi:hypothetical protein
MLYVYITDFMDNFTFDHGKILLIFNSSRVLNFYYIFGCNYLLIELYRYNFF